MNTPSLENAAILTVQLTRAAGIFDGLANALIAQMRRAMAVPLIARVEVERELTRLRARLDGFFPEYQQLFGGLLLGHIGPEHTASVLAALRNEVVQEYFRAVPRMDLELQGILVDLARRMSRAAGEGARERPSAAGLALAG